MNVATASPLRDMLSIVRSISELTEEMKEAVGQVDYTHVLGLCERNTTLREKLAEARLKLRGFSPGSTDDIRQLQELKELTHKVAEGDRLFRLWKQDMATYELLGCRAAGNTLMNAPRLPTTPSVGRLYDAFKGRPAIVVAAGPSRDKQLPLLREYLDHAVVITMNRCVEAFVTEGITPDLVMVTDPQDVIVEHMEQVTPETIPTLVSRISVNPDVFSKETQSRFCYSDSSAHELGVMQSLGLTAPEVLAGGSVAHCCLGLALELGCDPVIMIGQDLAYTDDRLYGALDRDDVRLRRSTDEKFGVQEGKMRGETEPHAVALEKVKGFYGGEVTTNAKMSRMIDGFELVRKNHPTGARIINATEGGAFIPGMEHRSFRETLETYCSEAFEVSNVIHDTYRDGCASEPRTDVLEWLGSLEHDLTQIIRLAHACQKGLKRMKMSGKGLKKVKRTYARLKTYHEAVEYLLVAGHLTDKREAVREKRAEMDPIKELQHDFQAMGKSAADIRPLVRAAIARIKATTTRGSAA